MQGSPATGIGKRRSYTIILLLVVALALLALQPKLREWIGPARTPRTQVFDCCVAPDGRTVAVQFVRCHKTDLDAGVLVVDTSSWQVMQEWVPSRPAILTQIVQWDDASQRLLVRRGGYKELTGFWWLHVSDLSLQRVVLPEDYYCEALRSLSDGRYLLQGSPPSHPVTGYDRLYLWAPSRGALRQLSPDGVRAWLLGVVREPGGEAGYRAYWVGSAADYRTRSRTLWATTVDSGHSNRALSWDENLQLHALSQDCAWLACSSDVSPEGAITIQVQNLPTGATEQFKAPCRPDQLVWSSENGYLLGTGARMWVYDVAAKTLSTLSATDAPKAREGYHYAAGPLSTEGRFLVVADTVLEVVDAKTHEVRTVLDINKH